eukprot:1508699-Rhodomonas_salina.3
MHTGTAYSASRWMCYADKAYGATVMFRNKPPTRVVQNNTNRRGGGAYLGTSRYGMSRSDPGDGPVGEG